MENIVHKVRSSTKTVAKISKDVHINEHELKQFVNTINLDDHNKLRPLIFPLKFTSLEQEINFIALIDLLNFASGFRKELHDATERGAYDTICYGVMGMHLSRDHLDAEFFSRVMLTDVADFFGLPLNKEKEIQPGLTTFVDHELRALVLLITKVMNDTGKVLKDKGCKDLGDFILKHTLKPSSDGKLYASTFVEIMANTFPAFNDVSTYEGNQIFILKKVQLLAADLYRTLKGKTDKFEFVDIDQLTIMADNVVPAMLRKLKILELSDSLAKHIDEGKPLPSGTQEVELRALSIVACEEIVKLVKEKHQDKAQAVNEMNVDDYLWVLGKHPDYRKLERHYTQDTVFY